MVETFSKVQLSITVQQTTLTFSDLKQNPCIYWLTLLQFQQGWVACAGPDAVAVM